MYYGRDILKRLSSVCWKNCGVNVTNDTLPRYDNIYLHIYVYKYIQQLNSSIY